MTTPPGLAGRSRAGCFCVCSSLAAAPPNALADALLPGRVERRVTRRVEQRATRHAAVATVAGVEAVILALEDSVALEEVLRKITLLEQQLMALHQRITDQCGKVR